MTNVRTDKEILKRAALLSKVAPQITSNEVIDVRLINRQDLILLVNQYHTSLSGQRKRRERSRDYYRGRQWNDRVVVNGVSMSEEEYLKRQGRPPLKQNMIRPPIKNILGQYRSNPYKPIVFARNRKDQAAAEMMSCALESALSMNGYKERDARQLEEFLLSGMCIYKTTYSFDDVRECAIPMFRAISPSRWGCNTDVTDVEGEDIRFTFELKDMTLNDVISEYARDEVTEDVIRKAFNVFTPYSMRSGLDSDALDNLIVSQANDADKCRVIEVWQKEAEWRLYVHDRLDGSYKVYPESDYDGFAIENSRRLKLAAEHGMDVPLIDVERRFVKFWKTYHLSGYGDVIFETESPYAHNSHPYAVRMYPLLDGEVWGMVEELIDQQKMVNRNMVLFDFMMGAAAKGVLMVPADCVPDGMDLNDFADEWTKYNGVIKYKPSKSGQMPQQISANSTNIGITDMVQMQLKFMQEISGVQGAIQGKAPAAGTAASLYAQETQNAGLNVLDYLESFAGFLNVRDKKVLQVIKQFYTDKQYIAVSDSSYSEEAQNFDPEKVANIDFENAIAKGKDTPAYRMLTEEFLVKLLEAKYLNIEMFLEHSSQPFSDKLLQSFKKMRESMQNGEAPEGAPEAWMQQFQQEAGQMQGGQVDPRQAEVMKRLAG